RNAAAQNLSGAAILGIHLEGPYINPNKKGAQPLEGIRPPDVNQCLRYIEEAEGMVKLVTLAPELPRAFDLIRVLRDRGVVVSLGHSEADYETAVKAIEAGASHATHLFNAMPPLHHRKPGLVLACMNDPRVKVEIIADGVHLHPELVRMVIHSKGEDGVVLITDAMSAVGCPDGIYTLGTHTVYVKGDLCTLADGTIASSMLTMNRAVRNAVVFAGADLPQAARMASELPAEVCGVSHRKGSIEVGKDADLAILERDFSVWCTVVQGRIAYSQEALPFN
ncbi:MAG: N-acetylglucosamine-6-phosphate deacetylase, partial [Armatimonadota bacterium]